MAEKEDKKKKKAVERAKEVQASRKSVKQEVKEALKEELPKALTTKVEDDPAAVPATKAEEGTAPAVRDDGAEKAPLKAVEAQKVKAPMSDLPGKEVAMDSPQELPDPTKTPEEEAAKPPIQTPSEADAQKKEQEIAATIGATPAPSLYDQPLGPQNAPVGDIKIEPGLRVGAGPQMEDPSPKEPQWTEEQIQDRVLELRESAKKHNVTQDVRSHRGGISPNYISIEDIDERDALHSLEEEWKQEQAAKEKEYVESLEGKGIGYMSTDEANQQVAQAKAEAQAKEQAQAASGRGATAAPRKAPPSLLHSALQEYRAGIINEVKGLSMQAAADAKEATSAAAALQGIEAEADRFHKMSEDLKNRRVNKINDFNNKMKNAYTKRAEVADFKSWWSTRSTTQKVMAGIALAFGAFDGAGNKAADVLINTMEEDSKLQREDLKLANQIISSARADFETEMGALSDLELRADKLFAQNLKIGEIQLLRRANLVKNEKIKANLMQTAARLQQKYAEKSLEVAEKEATRDMQLSIKTMDKTAKESERTVALLGQVAKSETVAKDIDGDFEAVINAARYIDELMELTGTMKTKLPGSVLHARAQQLAGELQLALARPLLQEARFAESEREMIRKLVPDPAKLFTWAENNRERLKLLRSGMRRKLVTKVQVAGLDASKVIPVLDHFVIEKVK